MSQTTTTDYDDDELEDDDDEPEVPAVRQMRTELKETKKRAKRADDLEKENKKLKQQLAFDGAGVELSDKKRQALEALLGDQEPSKDLVRSLAVEMGWAEPSQEEQELQHDLATQQRVGAASQGAGQAGGGVITPSDVASWGVDKQVRFKQQHPVAHESLKRGEEVTGITFA